MGVATYESKAINHLILSLNATLSLSIEKVSLIHPPKMYLLSEYMNMYVINESHPT